MKQFKLKAPFAPRGDQPKAIRQLIDGINKDYQEQTLLGVTGSGKTFTMASVIAEVQRPALVISHNKTLAAQLCSEFREFFPENAVEYFVSYYDYYQPEAYIPQTDTYIEKDASINDEIDRLRHSATQAILRRADTLVVASVSCIYGIGNPQDYLDMTIYLEKTSKINRAQIIKQLVRMQFGRNDTELSRGKFRVKGDLIEISPADLEIIIRISLFDDTIENILILDPITGKILEKRNDIVIYPAKHWITPEEKANLALKRIEEELEEQLKKFRKEGKLLEAERLEKRTKYDLEMLREIGYCSGIENYSRHLSLRNQGEPPYTLIDYFPKNFLIFIDESHVTIPQLGGMYEGDQARKRTLIENGFRLPSALDNRPLKWDEFYAKIHQAVYVTATPGKFELKHSRQVVEQIVRPTGLIDPEVVIRPTHGQIDDLIGEIKNRVAKKERTLVTTLTKKMAEDLTDYLIGIGLKVRYLHSEIETLDRIQILRDLRLGEFDCLVGINLLREGLDLPEVSLVAILDADKEGFLRSETTLIQTMGRAARNVSGQVILYADQMTNSIQKALQETERRRKIQIAYNKEHGITPETIRKSVKDILEVIQLKETKTVYKTQNKEKLESEQILNMIGEIESVMKEAARNLEFEKAAAYRDELLELKKILREKEDPSLLMADQKLDAILQARHPYPKYTNT
ncbi:MAG: excinuclease ABC subunit UvrB [Firmicutes bacterium]|nr:excinuclease ABC subunit UvrB [Bacillota bacterium]